MNVGDNLLVVRRSLSGRAKLVAVSKFHPAEAILEVYHAGQRIFGESRVQELTAKQPLLPPDIEWHFIGTLQSNKVKYIAPFVSLIQSVDSVKLLQEIDRQAAKCRRKLGVLLEVHIAEEVSKHGFSAEECLKLFYNQEFDGMKNVEVRGLMGMATFTDDVEQVRREFKNLKALFEKIRSFQTTDLSVFQELSMGMSDDYPIAIEEGSTMVRIGTRIFGSRKMS